MLAILTFWKQCSRVYNTSPCIAGLRGRLHYKDDDILLLFYHAQLDLILHLN